MRPREKAMADKGYYRSPHCWCPPVGKMKNLTDAQKLARRKVTRIRQVNERLNGRIHGWGCMNKQWRYGPEKHKLCAHAAARLTQLEVHAFPLT